MKQITLRAKTRAIIIADVIDVGQNIINTGCLKNIGTIIRKFVYSSIWKWTWNRIVLNDPIYQVFVYFYTRY